MKNMLKIVSVVMIILVVSSVTAMATTFVEIGNNGGLRTTNTGWKQTKISIPEDVLVYGDAWRDAYNNPGIIVPVEQHREIKKDGLFHVVSVIVADAGIKYDKDTGFSVVKQSVVVKTDRSFNPYLILWLLSMIAMVIFVVRMAQNDVFIYVAFAATAFAFAAAAFATAAFAFAAAAFAAIVATRNDKIIYIPFVVLYFVFMAISLSMFLVS